MRIYDEKGWRGKKRDLVKTCDLKDVNTLIREDIKKCEALRGCNVSVSKDNSGSIRIKLQEAIKNIYSDSYEKSESEKEFGIQINEYFIKEDKRLSDYGKIVFENLADIVENYNYNYSDAMTDYFDTGFYSHFCVSGSFRVVGQKPDREKRMVKIENATDLKIINYSEKAIAVVGDTKTYKEALKRLGGKFNPHLTCGCGWVFSKRQEEEVKRVLNIA